MRYALLLLLAALLAAGCSDPKDDALFERLPASATGVTFANTIVEDDSLLNPIDFDYVYNGGGVAAGDLDGDDRPDLYFAGNTVDNALYLNRGDFRFDDVTAQAGVAAAGAWSTGVALVDINQDGRLDVYVCVAGPHAAATRANRLYVNQGADADGVPRFEEQAEAYGLADTGYSTQAAFFDYDRDGDLDLYLLTNAFEDANRSAIRPRRTQGEGRSTDRLYRNEGDGTFTDASREAGLLIEGYGLGIAITDVNRDGWPDVYAANDFLTNDLLWINNQDGTFTNQAAQYLKHQSHNSMGADAADYNNDGRIDIAVVDMLPPSNARRKMMLTGESYNRFRMELRAGYEPQVMRNTLQLGNGPNSRGQWSFSEIGQLAGIHETDWSWAPLFADLDNDGWKDLFISNGYGKDVTNMDFVAYGDQFSMFGALEERRAQVIDAMHDLPEVKLPNVVYQNEGGLTFADRSAAWGLDAPSLSNGAAVADLDGDGDLDLVTNNIGDAAFVLKNRAREQGRGHFLRVRLEGPPGNRRGLGTTVTLRREGRMQMQEASPYRGYKSTVEHTLHFGLGADTLAADTLVVAWPDGRRQRLTGVAANQVLTLRHADARVIPAADEAERPAPPAQPLFAEAAAQHGLTFVHEEDEGVDFARTPLLPHQYSKSGPGLAVGDADGDGLDDVYVGGDKGRAATLFRQRAPGQFTRQPFPAGAEHEDMGALFFDAEGDGDRDLFVVSGGGGAPAGSAAYQDRLYLNDGRGGFQRDTSALPDLRASGSCVRAADYDGDGDLDLFVGGRVVPGRYPLPPRSALLRNDSDGGQARFTDVTEEVAPALTDLGLVTDALWTDPDGDGRIDLLVAGEWMPLTLLQNDPGAGAGSVRFHDATDAAGLGGTAGWWNSLTAGDFDGDGDTDYAAGNLGLNTKYDASPEAPVRIYAKDFDDNGSLDPVTTRHIEGAEHPVHARDQLVAQMAGMKRRFETYRAYADAPFDAVLTPAERADAYTAEAVHFETSYLENQGGTFAVRPLPLRAQFAPVFGMQTRDYDGDGHLDLLLAGNSYAPDPQTGRYDASIGVLLAGDGQGAFAPVDLRRSGFFVDGDAKAMAEVALPGGQPLVLVTQNSDSLRAFAPTPDARTVRLRPLDRYAHLTFADGRTRRQEFYYGSTYLSQSSRTLHLPPGVQSAEICSAQGACRPVTVDRASDANVRPAAAP